MDLAKSEALSTDEKDDSRCNDISSVLSNRQQSNCSPLATKGFLHEGANCFQSLIPQPPPTIFSDGTRRNI